MTSRDAKQWDGGQGLPSASAMSFALMTAILGRRVAFFFVVVVNDATAVVAAAFVVVVEVVVAVALVAAVPSAADLSLLISSLRVSFNNASAAFSFAVFRVVVAASGLDAIFLMRPVEVK